MSDPTIPAESTQQILRMLQMAISELLAEPDETIFSARFNTAHEVAYNLESLARRLAEGDADAGHKLYMAFLATSDWDDAGGSHELGNRICESLGAYRDAS